jgi:hypothetical protein
MEGTTGTTYEDSRKKRDSTDIVETDDTQCEEKIKKLRAATALPSTKIDDEIKPTPKTTFGCIPDLEVSLQRIVHLGENDNAKEYLSKTKWVQFRVGNASDALAIAKLYRKSKVDTSAEPEVIRNKVIQSDTSQREDILLEDSLAEGLGDEDSPPSIFALLADLVCDDEDDRTFAAASVFSSGWDNSTKVLMVKMLYVSDDVKNSSIAELLERRMWLRLAALALMTSSEMIVESGATIRPHPVISTASEL